MRKWYSNRHGVKVGPGPRNPGPRDPGTRDLGTGPETRDPPQSLKVGLGTPLMFESGTPGPPSKFKRSGTHSPFFNRVFNRFLSLCLF